MRYAPPQVPHVPPPALPGAPDLRAIDLNLLVALDALLAERSVTAAAKRLGLTQPTTSHALARLRALLGDPLLVRAGRAMVRTPRADALAPALSRALLELSRALAAEPPFDPKVTTRSFVVACPDLLAPLVPAIARRLAVEAPRAALELRAPLGADLPTALATSGVDLALAPAPSDAPGVIARSLGALRWCVLARRGHPLLRGRARARLTLASWTRWPHVVVRTGSESRSVVGDAIARAGGARRVGLVVPGFLVVPHVVAATDLLGAAPRELVLPLARTLGLELLEPPVAMPPIPVAALWHERWHADAGARWARELVAGEVGRALDEARVRGASRAESAAPSARPRAF